MQENEKSHAKSFRFSILISGLAYGHETLTQDYLNNSVALSENSIKQKRNK